MDLKISIGYQQFVELIAQLPAAELEKLAVAIQQQLKAKQSKKQKTALQKLLLQAPTWTEQEYQNYLEAKAHLNQFRKA
jgi:hypothetical protein